MPTTFTGIQNENEFYSHHYLSEVFTNDIKATTTRWRETAERASLYISATRAKKELNVLSYVEPSPFRI